MEESKMLETLEFINAYFGKREISDYIKSKKDPDEMNVALATIYIRLVKDDYLVPLNLAALSLMAEEKFSISLGDDEDFFRFLIGIYNDLNENNDISSIQTKEKAGYVYVLINSSMEGIVKIGMTRRDPEARINELSNATGVPTPFILVYKEYFDDCVNAELIIHGLLEDKDFRVSQNREFFSIPIHEAISLIQEVKKNLPENAYVDADFSSSRESNFNKTDLIEELLDKGMSALNGLGDTLQNFSKAFGYYEKAGKLGSAKAYLEMGQAYVNTLYEWDGLELNINKALEYFEKGAALSNGKYANQCVGEMAVAFSGYYRNIDKDYNHFGNARICWRKFFKYLNLSNCYFEYGVYLHKYIQIYLSNIENNKHKDDFFEKSLQFINWFKYFLMTEAETDLERVNSFSMIKEEEVKYGIGFLNKYFTFDREFLASNRTSLWNCRIDTKINSIRRVDEQTIAISAVIGKDKLQIDNVISLDTRNRAYYTRIIDIKKEIINLSGASEFQNDIIVVEDTFNMDNNFEYEICLLKDNFYRLGDFSNKQIKFGTFNENSVSEVINGSTTEETNGNITEETNDSITEETNGNITEETNDSITEETNDNSSKYNFLSNLKKLFKKY